MRGAAAQYESEADDGVVSGGERLRDDRKLDGPGSPQHGRVGDPALVRGAHGAVEQGAGDLLVPAGGDDRQPQARRVDRRIRGAPEPLTGSP